MNSEDGEEEKLVIKEWERKNKKQKKKNKKSFHSSISFLSSCVVNLFWLCVALSGFFLTFSYSRSLLSLLTQLEHWKWEIGKEKLKVTFHSLLFIDIDDDEDSTTIDVNMWVSSLLNYVSLSIFFFFKLNNNHLISTENQ